MVMTVRSNSLEILTAVPSELEAQLIANVLREHGVEATITGAFTSQFRAHAPGMVQVLVRQPDMSVAASILAELVPPQDEPGVVDEDNDLLDEGSRPSGWARLSRWIAWTMLGWDFFWLAASVLLVAFAVAKSLSGGSTVVVLTLLLIAAALAAIFARRRGRQ